MSLLDKACSVPWLIQEDALHGLLEIASRGVTAAEIEAVASRQGAKLEGTRLVSVREGVATLNVRGPIFRHASMLDSLCGATSTEAIAKEFTLAVANPDIKAILLNIDSPGGQATGIAELSQMIREARGAKPIVAYADGSAASAAYWIASAADEVVASPTAFLGSIGAVSAMKDANSENAKAGVIQFVSSQSPKKRPDIATDEGRRQIQNHVDSLAEEFVIGVAANRGVTREKVLAKFGQGDTFIGRDAVKAGLADKVSTYEKTHKRLASGGGKSAGSRPAARGPSMNFRERFLALFSDAEDAEAAVTTGDDGSYSVDLAKLKPDNTFSLPAVRQASDTQAASAEATALREENERLKAFFRDQADQASAEFAQSHAARLGFPAAKDDLAALALQAALDDRADGGSRLGNLKAFVSGLPDAALAESRLATADDVIVPVASKEAEESDADRAYRTTLAAEQGAKRSRL